jgi:hypothetical protein
MRHVAVAATHSPALSTATDTAWVVEAARPVSTHEVVGAGTVATVVPSTSIR